MKKLFVVGALSAGLVACGGGGGGSSDGGNSNDPNQMHTPKSNVLSIKGNGINREETITVDTKDIVINAVGNQPIEGIWWHPKLGDDGGITQRGFGSIDFGYNYKAKLGYLDFGDKTDTTMYCSEENCVQTGSYDFAIGTQQTTLSINFDQVPNTYHYQLNGKEKTIPVKLNGKLQFNFPSNWPVLQSQRFPVITPQGQFLLNGYPLKISSLPVTEKDPVTNQLTHTIRFGDDDPLILKVVDLSSGSYQVSLNDGENIFKADVNTSPWQETAKGIKLTLGQQLPLGHLVPLELLGGDGENDYSQKVSANLQIPKAFLDITIDGKVPESIEFGGGFAENESTYYRLDLQQKSGGTTSYSFVNVLKAADGHLWLTYPNGLKVLMCGSPTKACDGLRLDADQKTYHLNNVKAGNSIINGTLYFPGVFK